MACRQDSDPDTGGGQPAHGLDLVRLEPVARPHPGGAEEVVDPSAQSDARVELVVDVREHQPDDVAAPLAPVPIVATLLLAEFGSSSAIAVYVILAALVCGVVIALAPAAWTPAEPDPARPLDTREPTPTPAST